MTFQVHYRFRYQAREFAIAAFPGNGLFVPGAFGLTPVWMSTACYRGYQCTYEVADAMLLIRELQIQIGNGTGVGSQFENGLPTPFPFPFPFAGASSPRAPLPNGRGAVQTTGHNPCNRSDPGVKRLLRPAISRISS